MTNTMQTIVVIAAAITLCSGSAIPMWEFLSRGEKVRENIKYMFV